MGRFTGVDELAEEAIYESPYCFGGNNPISFNDPLGLSKYTGTLTAQDNYDMVMAMVNAGASGSMSNNNDGTFTMTMFGGGGGSADYDVFSAGADYMAKYNLWGTHGFAASSDAAKAAYYNLGGTDQAIRYILPPIYLQAKYKTSFIGCRYLSMTNWIDVKRQMMMIGYSGFKEGGGILNNVQTGLDIGGSSEIPIFSQLCDILSGGISAYNGDWVGAGMSLGGAIIPGLSQAKLARRGLKLVDAATNVDKVKYIGRLEDLKGIPRNQTILDDLPDLGNPKANYYQNMSVLRKAIRDGYTIKDASSFRPNSELAPTLLNPNRTIGQTFLGAERLLLKNKGLLP